MEKGSDKDARQGFKVNSINHLEWISPSVSVSYPSPYTSDPSLAMVFTPSNTHAYRLTIVNKAST